MNCCSVEMKSIGDSKYGIPLFACRVCGTVKIDVTYLKPRREGDLPKGADPEVWLKKKSRIVTETSKSQEKTE